MAISNANLKKARKAKNDEFYTQLTDVAKEMMHYKEHFKDKIVFCNCDNPTWSAFWKYFHLNFTELGLKKLISTHYDKEKATYKMEYTGGDDNNIYAGVKTPLKDNGDFRNQESIDLLDECDIVVTNPPFSLFREYVAILIEHKKKFIILGNMNALTYKEIFPLFRDNRIWYGASIHSGNRKFYVPDYYPLKASVCGIDENGKRFIKVKCVRWFTNLDYPVRHEKLILRNNYTSEKYPKYDNYDAINVNRIAEIPCDYDGVMGVPITFMDFYCPEQFEIVAFRKGDDGKDLVFMREEEREFNRTFVSLYDVDCGDDKKRRRENQWKAYLCKNNNQTEIEPIDYFFPLSIKSRATGTMNGLLDGKETYRRILIKKKGKV